MRRVLALSAILLLSGGAHPPAVEADRLRLIAAKRAAAEASRRAAAIGDAAARETDAATRARTQRAALAARVAAAALATRAADARVGVVAGLLARDRAVLGAGQAPIARLLAALQSLALRPAAVAIAQPGSIDDLVHVRAVLGAAIPVIEARTAAIRAQVERTRTLQADARLAADAARDARVRLDRDRAALAALEARHRDRAVVLGQAALSQSDIAIALGERARDIVDQMSDDDLARDTAADLAGLPDPRARTPVSAAARGAAAPYRLPVSGRLVVGFDELADAGYRARGLTFAVAGGAPVVAPAGGAIVYAGRFRGFGDIVVIDHGAGWTTLVSGLAGIGVRRTTAVRSGALLGRAARGGEARVTVELRRHGRPVDIVALIG